MKLLTLVFIFISCLSQSALAVEVDSNKPYQYPDVWVRAYPDSSKASIGSGLIRVIDDEATGNSPEVIMKVVKWSRKNGKRFGEDYAIGFFSGKNYGKYRDFMNDVFKSGKRWEISKEKLELSDGKNIRTFIGYLSGRLYDGLPLVNYAIGREANSNDPEWLWAKFIAMRINGKYINNSVFGVLDLGDGTLLAQGSTFVVRLNIKDGSSRMKHKDIRILDYEAVKDFVEKTLEEGERIGVVDMSDGRTMLPYIEQKALQEYFK